MEHVAHMLLLLGSTAAAASFDAHSLPNFFDSTRISGKNSQKRNEELLDFLFKMRCLSRELRMGSHTYNDVH